MDAFKDFLIVIGLFLLRFGVPVAVTAIVVKLFQRLDARWQAEVLEYQKHSLIENDLPGIRCWMLLDYPNDRLVNCPTYKDQRIPCWQQLQTINGVLKDDCLICDVYLRDQLLIPESSKG